MIAAEQAAVGAAAARAAAAPAGPHATSRKAT